MRVLFVYTVESVNAGGHGDKPLLTWSDMQFGISYISSVLKENGHNTSLVVLRSDYRGDLKSLQNSIDNDEPQLVCFTAVFSQYHYVAEVASLTKQRWPGTFLVIGGAHATLQPDEVVKGPFDAICVGEGEYPVLELCQQLEAAEPPGNIPNLWMRTAGGDVQKNLPRNFVEDLDALPFPDRVMWEPWIGEKDNDEMVVFGGRGCPYNCSYCSNQTIRNVARGSYVRMRSPENIISEIDCLHKQYDKRIFNIEVETLDINKSWTRDLCNKLEKYNTALAIPLTFGSNYRVNPQTIDESIFAVLKKANFSFINIGLESGSEELRHEILRREYTNTDFLKVVSLAKKHGMKVYVYNMIGLPGESSDDHAKTVEINRQIQPDGHYTGIFFPYPGTELYSVCHDRGYIGTAMSTSMERRRPVLTLPKFSRKQIYNSYVWFNFHVYRGYKPIVSLLQQVLMVKIFSSPLFFDIYKILQRMRIARINCHQQQ